MMPRWRLLIHDIKLQRRMFASGLYLDNAEHAPYIPRKQRGVEGDTPEDAYVSVVVTLLLRGGMSPDEDFSRIPSELDGWLESGPDGTCGTFNDAQRAYIQTQVAEWTGRMK